MAYDDEAELDSISPDKNRLDEEWEAQPRLVLKCGLELLEAEETRDRLEVELELCIADLDADIREDPEKYGIPKVTEDAVKKCIKGQKKYTIKTNKLAKAKRTVAYLRIKLQALENRKKALENLVMLHGRSYFAEPNPKEEEYRPSKAVSRGKRLLKKKHKH